MDGFDATGSRAVVIGATNRKADLDPALLSRFDMVSVSALPGFNAAAGGHGADGETHQCARGVCHGWCWLPVCLCLSGEPGAAAAA